MQYFNAVIQTIKELVREEVTSFALRPTQTVTRRMRMTRPRRQGSSTFQTRPSRGLELDVLTAQRGVRSLFNFHSGAATCCNQNLYTL